MPAVRIDLLSQMLTLVRMRGELVLAADLNGPFALQFERGAATFHFVSEGNLFVKVGPQAPIHATSGDLLLLPHGEEHMVADDPGARPVAIKDLLLRQQSSADLVLRHAGPGNFARVIMGQFRFDNATMPSIMATLPSVIHIQKTNGVTAGWLEGLAHFLLEEARTPNPGASLMISRLIDVLVIRTLRTWVHATTETASGWLGALGDTRISRALEAIHEHPSRRWTVGELATIAGMSRSSFAERFASLIGEAPLHYHNRWRLSLARTLLQQEGRRVSDVGRQIGYESDAAFSRAFKRHFGHPPAEDLRGAT